jgi:hypothetical protein
MAAAKCGGNADCLKANLDSLQQQFAVVFKPPVVPKPVVQPAVQPAAKPVVVAAPKKN